MSDAKKTAKKYKVKRFFSSQVAVSWPGHFAGMLSIDENKVKGVEMFFTSDLPGFVVIKHKGATAITNGPLTAELELTTPTTTGE